jgi:hypothetical protein
MDGIRNTIKQAGVDFINGARDLGGQDSQANKLGKMAHRTVSNLTNGASSVLNALKEKANQAGSDFVLGMLDMKRDNLASKAGNVADEAAKFLKEGLKGVKDNMLDSRGYTARETKPKGLLDYVIDGLRKSESEQNKGMSSSTKPPA